MGGMIPKPSFLDAQFVTSAVVLLVVMNLLLVMAGVAIYLERKLSAYIQDRVGPNRVGFDLGLPLLQKLFGGFGFWGLGQSLADGIKMLLKEDYTPRGVDTVLFRLAPGIVVIPALLGFAVIPWGGEFDFPRLSVPVLGWTIEAARVEVVGAAINIGVIYLLATASLSIYGIALGSWASNNKYSFLGGLRASSQMLAYEIPMGLCFLSVLLVVGSLVPRDIVAYQHQHGWLILSQPLTAVLLFVCVLAECNRAPFDNAECEQELVGGYHTEYSSMRFGLFFLAEYAHMATSSAMWAVLFLGGTSLVPFANLPLVSPDDAGILAVLAKFSVLFGKMFLLVCFMIVIRWSLPRLRFDQVMQAGWQGMIPVTLLILVTNALVVFAGLATLPMLLLSNLAVAGVAAGVQPLLPKRPANHKIRLAGSRFSPLDHESVLVTTRAQGVAVIDDPRRTSALSAH
ncbi:MAG: hypothetical protein C0468_05135 [Planctomyces sp.]|nr:hypothetical protein [Planctomyces sp.]